MADVPVMPNPDAVRVLELLEQRMPDAVAAAVWQSIAEQLFGVVVAQHESEDVSKGVS